MQFDLLSCDYGILPHGFDAQRRVTNPYELFDSPEWEGTLCLCGVTSLRKQCSDYDRFFEICKSLPMLTGHPLREWVTSVLRERFGITDEINAQNAAVLWKAISAQLSETPLLMGDLLGQGHCLCSSPQPPARLPSTLFPMLNANLLLETQVDSLAVWSEQIAHCVKAYRNAGGSQVFLQVMLRGEFVAPGIYRVEEALRSSKRNEAQKALLLAQLTRELCSACIMHGMRLIVKTQTGADLLAALLQYVEKTVGLPALCWITSDSRYVNAMLEFQAQPHAQAMDWGICAGELLTDFELAETLNSAAARYPVGRLRLITAYDVRLTAYAQNVLKKRVQAWLEKKEKR